MAELPKDDLGYVRLFYFVRYCFLKRKEETDMEPNVWVESSEEMVRKFLLVIPNPA